MHIRQQRLATRPTPLLNGNGKVLLLGANEQMVWTNATPVVAAMTHNEPFRDRAVVQLPRESVCAPPLGNSRIRMTAADMPVAMSQRASPLPADRAERWVGRTIEIDLAPETINNRSLTAPRNAR